MKSSNSLNVLPLIVEWKLEHIPGYNKQTKSLLTVFPIYLPINEAKRAERWVESVNVFVSTHALSTCVAPLKTSGKKNGETFAEKSHAISTANLHIGSLHQFLPKYNPMQHRSNERTWLCAWGCIENTHSNFKFKYTNGVVNSIPKQSVPVECFMHGTNALNTKVKPSFD
jgi:hypothetical protein